MFFVVNCAHFQCIGTGDPILPSVSIYMGNSDYVDHKIANKVS